MPRLCRANAKDFRLHAWRATKGATRKSFVVIRTRALTGGDLFVSHLSNPPRLNHHWGIKAKTGVSIKFRLFEHQTESFNKLTSFQKVCNKLRRAMIIVIEKKIFNHTLLYGMQCFFQSDVSAKCLWEQEIVNEITVNKNQSQKKHV